MRKDIEVTIKFVIHNVDVDEQFIDETYDVEQDYLIKLTKDIITDDGVDNFLFEIYDNYEIIDAIIVQGD